MSMSVSDSNTLISASCDPETLPEKLKHFIVDPETGCWLWTGQMKSGGYGMVQFHGTSHTAHRAVYEFFFGEIDHAIPIHHHCEHRECVNPAHLEAIPQYLHSRLRAGAKLTASDVYFIRWLNKTKGMSPKAISREYGYSHGAVCGVTSGTSWRSLS